MSTNQRSYTHAPEFYDAFGEYADRPDVPFFVKEAVESGGPVLELGCGTGRVLISTARAGVSIVGLDRAGEMLSKCKEKLAREPADVQARVRLVHGDMRSFALGETFRLVTIPFRPFQHLLTVEDQLACLECIRQHLDDGGRLIADVFNPSLRFLTDDTRLQERDSGAPFTLPDGRVVRRRERIAHRDLFQQIQQVELIHYVAHSDGRQERLVDSFPMRYLFRFEAEHLLVRAGFEIVSLFSDYDRSPYGSKDPCELIFIARKSR